MATKKPSAAQLAARAAFTKMVKERARLRAAGKLPPAKRKTKAAKKRKISAPPSPAQLAARKKFVAMVKAKAKVKKGIKQNSRGFSTRPPALTSVKRKAKERKANPKRRKREVEKFVIPMPYASRARTSVRYSRSYKSSAGEWKTRPESKREKRERRTAYASRKRNPGVIKMSEAEFAKLGKKLGLGSVSPPVRPRSVSAAPRRKAQRKFKKVGVFGGSGFLGLGKSIQKISRNPKGEHLPGLAPKFQRMYEDILASSGSKRIAAATTMKAVKNPGLFGTIRSLIGIGGKKRKTAKVGYRKTQRGTFRPTTYMEKASLSHGRPQLHFATNPRRKPGHVQASYGKGRKAYKRAKARGVTDYFPRMDKAILRGAAVSRGHSRSLLPNPPSKHRKQSSPRGRKVLAAHYKAGLLERRGSPGSLKKLYKTVKRSYNPAPSKVFSEFRGKEVTRQTKVRAATGTPSTLAELGRLKELKLRGRTLKFKAGRLAADARKRLHIVGVKMKYRGNPGGEVDCGEILAVTYEASKPHIEKGTYNYVHAFGEEGGVRPHLIVDPEGYPKIEGGSYGITSDGIID